MNATEKNREVAKNLGVHIALSVTSEKCREFIEVLNFQKRRIFQNKLKIDDIFVELLYVYTAITIHCINVQYDTNTSKKIIDPLLELLRTSVFRVAEKKTPRFRRDYSEKIQIYYDSLRGRPMSNLTDVFLRQLKSYPYDFSIHFWSNMEFSVFSEIVFSAIREASHSDIDRACESSPLTSIDAVINSLPLLEATKAIRFSIDLLAAGQSNKYGVNRYGLNEKVASSISKIVDDVEKLSTAGSGNSVRTSFLKLMKDRLRIYEEKESIHFDLENSKIDVNAELYHKQIDELVEKLIHYFSDNFSESCNVSIVNLRKLAVTSAYVATLMAIRRTFPKVDGISINGFTVAMASRISYTKPNTPEHTEEIVNYLSVEESFLFDKLKVFKREGEEVLIKDIYRILGGRPEQYNSFKLEMQNASHLAAQSFVPHLAEE